jgi:AraC-like DNA-binding protein
MRKVDPPPRCPRPPGEHWSGELIVGEGWARFFGRAGAATPQACESVQIVTAVCSWSVIGAGSVAAKPTAGAIVRHDETVRIGLERPHVMILFIDARLPAGALVEEGTKTPIHRLSFARAARWRRALFGLSPAMSADQVLQALPLDGRRGLRPPAIAGASTLGSWRRVAAFAHSSAQGTQLVEAARTAGFTSVAHCTRTFRQLFGLSPTLLGFAHDDSVNDCE